MKLATLIAGYLLMLFTLIPLVRNDNWIFRIFEYPRFQKLIMSVIVLFGFILQFNSDSTHDVIFLGMQTINIVYLCYLIFPYTRIASNQMYRLKQAGTTGELSMLICNVYQDNKNVEGLLHHVMHLKPDLLLVVEVDGFWTRALERLHTYYPHRLLKPLENTYGMSLYSKLELQDPEIRFLVKHDVPSITTFVKLKNGQLVKVYALHPEPPVPGENPRSTERDAEILTVAKEVKQQHLPVIVAGDLNDVAWSYTTELFMKVSGLLDPRRGRGFFNTFHVKYPLWRWPLDHVFCSPHFRLLHLERLSDVGSDHFPIFISVALSEGGKRSQSRQKLASSVEEEKLANRKTEKATGN
jgi:endonuclease/exonuclease/phosphatase (EEP) superfamily protein YafD